MILAVGLQVAVVVALALLAGAVWGMAVALSLAFGGGAAIIPNALFALRLALHRGRTPESYPVVFFIGEIFKIGLTVALLVWAATSIPQLRWPPLLAGLIAALHAPFLVPLVGSWGGKAQQSVSGQEQRIHATRQQSPTRENR
jgi:ATP synthase protein I